jgi:hypothetical protein
VRETYTADNLKKTYGGQIALLEQEALLPDEAAVVPFKGKR